MQNPPGPAVAFYGDDFTGSSENLAQYHRHGLRAILFLDGTRVEEMRRRAADYDVVGIAGVARSLAPGPMAGEIRPAFAFFRDLGCRFVQYKICSTFDSAPEVGSFGVALAQARATWPGCFVPVHAAMPEQGRFTAFGNHFTRFGDRIFRLDRHPSMSRHPSTPMTEADLGVHLARQTDAGITYITAPMLDGAPEAARAVIEQARRDGAATVFDGLTDGHLVQAARLVWEVAGGQQVFALAAQGMAHGLGQHLAPALGRRPAGRAALAPVERMLVLSGSCALQAALQIRHAEEAGWAVVRLDVPRLLDPAGRDAALEDVRAEADRHFREGRDVIVLTARGPDDPALPEVRAALSRLGLTADRSAKAIGDAFAALGRGLAGAYGLRRIVFSGGDTSSYAVRALGALALTIDRVDVGGSGHMCRLHADDPAVDGLQVMLKGGQMGDVDVFLSAKSGA